ncbi:MAG: DUF2752 domain-containing protein [Paraprevotella sp.]|nr:DUF2752 domain-containing protein [Paraprevotella sp.]
MNVFKPYIILGALALIGYVWLFYALYTTDGFGFTPCLFKNVTGIPCPACGTTRAIILIVNGRLWQSLLLNPLGLLAYVVMFILPFWWLVDAVRRRPTFALCYARSEKFLQRKLVFWTFVLLMFLNMIWNIYKGL